MPSNQLSVFATGNGDCVLLEANGTVVLTDVNYRDGCDDDEQDDKPDFASEMRDACIEDRLHLLVCTHPDIDHVRGAEKLFHMGKPEDWDDDPDEGEPKILIEEIWCSPYAVRAYVGGDAEKPLIEEIKRRNALKGTAAANVSGNKLTIQSASDDEVSGVFRSIRWEVLAPTDEEANIPADGSVSSNDTSLAIQWEIPIGGGAVKVLLLGDATVNVVERLGDEILPTNPQRLEWNIMVAPHHCSRRSLGHVENPGKDEQFLESQSAISALSEQLGNGYIVSSSRSFKREGSPPSTFARNRYWRILDRVDSIQDVSDSAKERFVVTGGQNGEDPAHVFFELTSSGPSPKGLRRTNRIAAVATAASAGGSYGR